MPYGVIRRSSRQLPLSCPESMLLVNLWSVVFFRHAYLSNTWIKSNSSVCLFRSFVLFLKAIKINSAKELLISPKLTRFEMGRGRSLISDHRLRIRVSTYEVVLGFVVSFLFKCNILFLLIKQTLFSHPSRISMVLYFGSGNVQMPTLGECDVTDGLEYKDHVCTWKKRHKLHLDS